MVVMRAIKEIKSKIAISDSSIIHTSSYFNIVLRILTF